MATLLSSPLGPSTHNGGKYDIFDQPSSPSYKHAELPAEFGDQSFGSSMSLGSSFELNRMAASSSTSSQLSTLSVSALGPRRIIDDQQTTTIRLPRKSPPRSNPDSLGASMGTILNSRSPHLAAKMNTSDYMDMSSPPPSARRKGVSTPSRDYPSDKDENLPPGSAMKEDTPVKYNPVIRRTVTEAPTSGASLGRLFGTELSLNTRHQSFQPNRISKLDDDSFSSQNSPDKEPPSKRRPSSLPLVPGPICNRPILRSNGGNLTPSTAGAGMPSRRVGLLESMTTNQAIDGKVAKKRASLEALHQRQKASDTIVPAARTFTMCPPRRSRSGSSEDRDVLPRTSLPPLHPTIIESPSPSALQHEDFGTYFFDPQSPEHTKVVAKPNSISSRLDPALIATQNSSKHRTFEKAASSVILPSMLSVANSGSTLGKRTNPYAKRPSLSAIQNHELNAEKHRCGPAASTSNSIASTRMTAPAPRRCQSAIDNSAAFAQAAEDLTMNSVDTSTDQSGLLSPSEYRSQCKTSAAVIRQFPPGFDASGSPMAPSARPKLRPGMLRKTSKDDSSPLGYGISKRLTQKVSEGGLHAVPLCVDESSSSPLRAAEGLPGFGASEREGKVLPCFNIKDDGLMRITPATLVKVMKGVYRDVMESFQIVDCRFGYEYEGGHIAGAINLSTMEKVKKYFLQPDELKSLPLRSQSGKVDSRGIFKKKILIFHCEFSAKRAPSMALALRQADRSLAHDYPNCHYPEIYILQGGYCGFYKEYADICEPRHYVQMDDPKFQEKRSKELNGFRKQFARHRSFTYGDGANTVVTRVPYSDGTTTLLPNPSFDRPVIIQEENLSFEYTSKSPSAIQAEVIQARRKGGNHHLRIDTIKGLGEKPLLGSAPATIGDLSFGCNSMEDESSSFEGGLTDSPCAAAAAATSRNRPAPIFLKPGNSKTFSANTGNRLLVTEDRRGTGGSLGRHTFQRAAIAAHIQLR